MTKIVFTVTDASGNPEEGATIDIQLPEAGINTLDENAILPTSVKVKTDEFGKVDNGLGYIELEPVLGIEYVAVITGANKKRKGIYKFIVPQTVDEEGNPTDELIKWTDLVLSPPPSGLSYDAAAIADITNERILAQQAAASGIDIRYRPIDAKFANSGGIYTFTPSASQGNGFFIVNESSLSAGSKVGTVIIPEDETTYFKDGTTFLFIRDNLSLSGSPIDISFSGASREVDVKPLGLLPVKLESPTDVIQLIKVSDNNWKIFNLTESVGEGGGASDAVTQATFAQVFSSINGIEGRISQILTAQASYIDHLNIVEKRMSDNDAATSALNNAVASISAILAGLNATIDRKITEAVPGLGDLTAFVEQAEDARDVSISNAITAGNASESATQSAQDAVFAKDDSQAARDAILLALGSSNIIANSLADLVVLPYPDIQSAFLEGIDSPSLPQGTAQRYWYDPTSTAQINDKFSVESTDQVFVDARAAGTVSNEVLNTVILPTYEIVGVLDPLTPDDPGRWIALPIELTELQPIDNGTNENNLHTFLMTPEETGLQYLEPVGRNKFKKALRITATNNANTTDVAGLGSNAFDNGYPAPPAVPYAWEILYEANDLDYLVTHEFNEIFRGNHNEYEIVIRDWVRIGGQGSFEPWFDVTGNSGSSYYLQHRMLEEADKTVRVDYAKFQLLILSSTASGLASGNKWRTYWTKWLWAYNAGGADIEHRPTSNSGIHAHIWDGDPFLSDVRPTGFRLRSDFPSTNARIGAISIYGKRGNPGIT